MPHATAESSAPHELVRPRDLTLWPYVSKRRSLLWIGLAIALVFVVFTVGLHEFMIFLGSEPLRFYSTEVTIGAFVINGLLLG